MPPNQGVSIMKGQAALLRKRLSCLKLTRKEVGDALAFHDFQNEHFSAGAKIIGGGRIKLAQQLMTDIEDLRNKISELVAKQSNPATSGTDLPALESRERDLRKTCQISVQQYLQLAGMVEKGAIGWAEVEAQKEATTAQANRPIVGFKQLQVNVKGENVEIHDHGSGKPANGEPA